MASLCFDFFDSRAIKNNPDLRWTTPISGLFFNDFWGTPLSHSGSHKSYRPLVVLTFRLNYFISQFKPFSYHLVNVLLNTAVTLLYTHLSWVLYSRKRFTLASGLIFASHPIHTEAVSGIVGRADVAAGLFFMLAFASYIKYTRTHNSLHLYATIGLAGLSMLCKETGITVLGLCIVYHLVISRVKNETWNNCLHQVSLAHAQWCILIISICMLILEARLSSCYAHAHSMTRLVQNFLRRFLFKRVTHAPWAD